MPDHAHGDAILALYLYTRICLNYIYILRKPAGRLGEVSPCERSEFMEGVWGRGGVT